MRAGRPLRIAAKIDAADRAYYEREIRPLFDHPLVEYVGELGDAREERVPGQRRRGAVPDRLARAVRPDHDRGARLRHAGDRLAARLRARGARGRRLGLPVRGASTRPCAPWSAIDALDRRRCRAEFERRFTAERMARDYAAVYERLLWHEPRSRPAFRSSPRRATTSAAWCSRAATASRCSTATATCGRPRRAGTACSSTARASSRRCACGSPGGGRCCSRRGRAAGTRGCRSTRPTPTCATGDVLRLPRESVYLHRSIELLDGGCRIEFALRSYAPEPVALELEFAFAADFADVFEVRGARREKRGTVATPVVEPRLRRAVATPDWIGSRATPGSPSSPLPSRSDRTSRSSQLELVPGERSSLSLAIDCELRGGRAAPLAGALRAAARAAPRAAVRAVHHLVEPRVRRLDPPLGRRPRDADRRDALTARSPTRACPGSARRSAATR